jgi:hypothetical protein
LAFVLFGGKTGFEFMCGVSVLREVREVLRNLPEGSYVIIILFSGNCAVAKILSFFGRICKRGPEIIVRVGWGGGTSDATAPVGSMNI